jgi:hypothetical protein
MQTNLPEPTERAPVHIPSPPEHLSTDAKRLWRAVTTEFDLGEPHLVLLRLAYESWTPASTPSFRGASG